MSTRQKVSRLRVSELAVCGLPTALKGTLLKELTVEDLHCGECFHRSDRYVVGRIILIMRNIICILFISNVRLSRIILRQLDTCCRRCAVDL